MNDGLWQDSSRQPQGDGSRTSKRLDRRDFEALMGGDGRSDIFTWREKNRGKARNDHDLVLSWLTRLSP